MNVLQPTYGGFAQMGSQSDNNFDAAPGQWMSMTTTGQPMLCGSMVNSGGSVCMPFMWPVGQTPEGNFVFASAVAPANHSGFANTPSNQSNEHSFENGANADSNRAPAQGAFCTSTGRRLRHGKAAPSTSDALTSDEIDELRLAVQNTYRKLQNPNSSEPFQLLSKDIAGFVHDPSKERDSDTLSSSSSTCIPESHLESDIRSQSLSLQSLGAVYDDSHHPFATADKSMARQCSSDSEVDEMFVELESLNADRRQMAIDWVVGSSRPLAFTRRGCRIVQRAMEMASSAEKEQIVENLEGFVMEALHSPHANYVLQKCFEIASSNKKQLILNELRGESAFIARHRFGCRVLQRALEHCSPEQNMDWVEEVLMDAAQLIRHTYGNFVIQHILQYGTPKQVHQVLEVLLEDAVRFAKHRIASHVVSCALSCCAADDILSLTEILTGEEGQLADLTRRQYGSFVVREVNRVNSRLRANN